MSTLSGTSAFVKRPSRVAALHRQGETWRVVVIRTAGGAGSGVALVEAASAPVRDSAALAAILARAKADVVVGVIPSGSTIVRTPDAPGPGGGNASEAAAAWDLLAEAHLPSTVPAHRRGAGRLRVTDGAFGDAASVGGATVAIGWTGEPPAGAPDVIARWVPEVAALAALLRQTKRGTPGVSLYADRTSGVMTLVASSTAGRLAVRVLREDGDDSTAWNDEINAARTEARQSVGLEPADGASSETASVMLELAQSTGSAGGIEGAPLTPEWLASYGIAAGAACAMSVVNGELGTLSVMLKDAPEDRSHPIRTAAVWLSTPRRAIIAAAACIAIVFLAYAGAAYGRLWILMQKQAAAGGDAKVYAEAQSRAKYYELVENHRWPMTKLVADIVSCAPAGITIDRLVLEQGKEIIISGSAGTLELIHAWRDTLKASGVFTNVAETRTETGSTPIVFDMKAAVVPKSAALPMKGTKDVVNTEVASATPNTGRNDRNNRTNATSRPDRNTNPGSNRNNTPGGRNPRGGDSADEIPSPISDEQIAQLDSRRAMGEFARRKSASDKATDAAVKQRLLDETEKIQKHRKQLSGGGGS